MSFKTLYKIVRHLREGSLKLLINRKKRFLKIGRNIYSEISEIELSILLTVHKVRCNMCNIYLTIRNLGYIRFGKTVELALCDKCLRDYIEYTKEVMKEAVASDR